MDELMALVEELEATKEEKPQIQILKKINKMLLTYVIQVGTLIIQPLWIEAYYYDQKSFPDCNTHE